MQLLLDSSEKFGATSGLEVIPVRVVPVPKLSISAEPQKMLHIAWNELQLSKNWLAGYSVRGQHAG